MKNIIKLIWVLSVAMLVSCEQDFLDINKDPNVPFNASAEQLLTGAQVRLAEGSSSDDFISTPLNVYTHQIVVRESPDQYGMPPSSVMMDNTWKYMYQNSLPNLDAIIEMAEKEENAEKLANYAAVAKILKAYMFTQLVDIWGDVPFSETNKNLSGIIHPEADDDAYIYNQCFDLLDEAMGSIDPSEIIAGDLIYGGNMGSWLRLANTLKLNMLNKTRLAKADIDNWDGKMETVMNAQAGFIKPEEHFEMYFTSSIAPDQRHPGFASGAYAGSQLTEYISPWIYEIMNGLTYNATENPFEGIQDPRVPYFWVNQLEAGEFPDNPHEYKDGQFLSIFFGSIGPYRASGQDATASTIGIYPVGGKYDDGQGGALSIDDGTGVAPQKYLTYSDYLFVRAELAFKEDNDPEAAAEFLRQGVIASFSHIDLVVAKSGTEQEVPVLSGQHDDFIDEVMNLYENAVAEKKFEIIMTQKWIAGFYNGIQNYADYRRTGYPKLFDPAGTSISPDPFDPEQPIVPTQLTRNYPASLWYPQREVEINPKINQKENQTTTILFWDK